MNYNKAVIVGRITKDIEVRQTESGKSVTSFTVVTNKIFKKDDKKVEKAEFHNVVAWGKLAEIAKQYLVKGQLVLVEGSIQTRNWDDKEGNKRYRTEIIADNFQMGPRPLTKPQEGSDGDGKTDGDTNDMPF